MNLPLISYEFKNIFAILVIVSLKITVSQNKLSDNHLEGSLVPKGDFLFLF